QTWPYGGAGNLIYPSTPADRVIVRDRTGFNEAQEAVQIQRWPERPVRVYLARCILPEAPVPHGQKHPIKVFVGRVKGTRLPDAQAFDEAVLHSSEAPLDPTFWLVVSAPESVQRRVHAGPCRSAFRPRRSSDR